MMATRKRLVAGTAIALAIAIVAGAAFLVRQVFFGPNTLTAYFPTATSIYPGDEVRVSGVKVGTIESIKPEGTQTKMVLNIDRDVPVPADAKAVIVAQNLIAARYVQLTPAYRNNKGPKMADGAVIPSDRTAVPIE
jgi:virulence factor Mce-like protein